jgi:hypothetical protein
VDDVLQSCSNDSTASFRTSDQEKRAIWPSDYRRSDRG